MAPHVDSVSSWLQVLATQKAIQHPLETDHSPKIRRICSKITKTAGSNAKENAHTHTHNSSAATPIGSNVPSRGDVPRSQSVKSRSWNSRPVRRRGVCLPSQKQTCLEWETNPYVGARKVVVEDPCFLAFRVFLFGVLVQPPGWPELSHSA